MTKCDYDIKCSNHAFPLYFRVSDWLIALLSIQLNKSTVFGLVCVVATQTGSEFLLKSLPGPLSHWLGCDLVIGAVSPVVSSHTKQTTCYNGIERLLTNTHAGHTPSTRYLLQRSTIVHNSQRGTLLTSELHVYSLSIYKRPFSIVSW